MTKVSEAINKALRDFYDGKLSEVECRYLDKEGKRCIAGQVFHHLGADDDELMAIEGSSYYKAVNYMPDVLCGEHPTDIEASAISELQDLFDSAIDNKFERISRAALRFGYITE